jgi:hypothetical protein
MNKFLEKLIADGWRITIWPIDSGAFVEAEHRDRQEYRSGRAKTIFGAVALIKIGMKRPAKRLLSEVRFPERC